jgi:hypothetical protein
MLVTCGLVVAGCAGIHQSGSVSPATFFLPGLMKTDPPMTNAPGGLVEHSSEIAVIR